MLNLHCITVYVVLNPAQDDFDRDANCSVNTDSGDRRQSNL